MNKLLEQAGADDEETLEFAAPHPDEHGMLQSLVLLAWSSHLRVLRGEYLYAQQCLESAVDTLLRLLQRSGELPLRRIQAGSPRRDLETHAPALARELLGILLGVAEIPEACLLEIAERELKPRAAGLGWEEVAKVRRRIRSA
jgi:hypothetical protein